MPRHRRHQQHFRVGRPVGDAAEVLEVTPDVGVNDLLDDIDGLAFDTGVLEAEFRFAEAAGAVLETVERRRRQAPGGGGTPGVNGISRMVKAWLAISRMGARVAHCNSNT